LESSAIRFPIKSLGKFYRIEFIRKLIIPQHDIEFCLDGIYQLIDLHDFFDYKNINK